MQSRQAFPELPLLGSKGPHVPVGPACSLPADFHERGCPCSLGVGFVAS